MNYQTLYMLKNAGMKASKRVPDIPFMNAIREAQTGDKKGEDTYIRTSVVPKNPKRSSTAYGPFQLTYSTLDDFMKRYPKRFTMYKPFLNNKMIPMYKLFKHHGRNKGIVADYDANYDYGGHGTPLTAEQKQMYNGIAMNVMQAQEEDLRKAGKIFDGMAPHDFLLHKVRRWRGQVDPAYEKRFMNYLYKNYPEYFEE